ncbi:uncharacterized protein KZ484_002319 [Pholidichthys leucotaenia]
MDAARKTAIVLAFSEYKRLQSKYMEHLKNIEEEDSRRRRMLMSILLQSTHEPVYKCATEWEAMINMDDDMFEDHFRVTKEQFEFFQLKLRKNGLEKEFNQGRSPLPTTKKVLMFLWYMATQNSFRDISNKFNVSQSSAHRVITEVLNIITAMEPIFISWPNASEKAESAAAFHHLCGLSDVIGVIDGCHIRVLKPHRDEDYKNRRLYYSFLLQGIVDEKGRFINIFAGPPGSVHDAQMLMTSNFFTEWKEKMENYRLLGDSAYFGQTFSFVLTPKPDYGFLPEADKLQNSNISRGRAVVDQAFGRLKCKWRRLCDLQNTQIDTAVLITKAACFLHNMCVSDSQICQEHPDGCPRQEDENE